MTLEETLHSFVSPATELLLSEDQLILPSEDGLTRLIASSEVPADRPVRVVIAGYEPLAVSRLGDEFFVTEDTCTHGNGSLSMGRLVDGNEIRCPVHRGTFDVRTGKAVKYPCTEPLMIFPTELREGEVWAALDKGYFAD